MRQIILIVTLLLAMGCSRDDPIVVDSPWERAELVGYTYKLDDTESYASYSFRENGTVFATFGEKGGPLASPILRWNIDEKGILNIGRDERRPDIRLVKIQVDGDQVIVGSPRGGGRSKYKKTKN